MKTGFDIPEIPVANPTSTVSRVRKKLIESRINGAPLTDSFPDSIMRS